VVTEPNRRPVFAAVAAMFVFVCMTLPHTGSSAHSNNPGSPDARASIVAGSVMPSSRAQPGQHSHSMSQARLKAESPTHGTTALGSREASSPGPSPAAPHDSGHSLICTLTGFVAERSASNAFRFVMLGLLIAGCLLLSRTRRPRAGGGINVTRFGEFRTRPGPQAWPRFAVTCVMRR
jgi:hypothetical protein